MSFRFACGAMAGAVLVTLAPAALAQDWPNRSIVAVSTVSAGNAADTVARIVLDQVSKQIGQSFVIENRTGAGGTIGIRLGRQGRSGRLDHPAVDALAGLCRRPVQEFALRPAARFRSGRAVRLAAERAGRRTVERLDVRHRAGGRRQG